MNTSPIVPAMRAALAAQLVMSGYAPLPPAPVSDEDVRDTFAILGGHLGDGPFPWNDFGSRHSSALLSMMPAATALSLVYRSSDSLPFAPAMSMPQPDREVVSVLLGSTPPGDLSQYLANGSNSIIESALVVHRLCEEYASVADCYQSILTAHAISAGITKWQDAVRAVNVNWTQVELVRLLITVSTTCSELSPAVATI